MHDERLIFYCNNGGKEIGTFYNHKINFDIIEYGFRKISRYFILYLYSIK